MVLVITLKAVGGPVISMNSPGLLAVVCSECLPAESNVSYIEDPGGLQLLSPDQFKPP